MPIEPPQKKGKVDTTVPNMILQLAADTASEAAMAVPAPPDKQAAKAKKRKERKGFMLCQGCDQSKPVELFALDQKVDRQCKLYLDRIYQQCKVQGKTQWFSTQRRTPAGTKGMLDYYRTIMTACGVEVTPKFSHAHYTEFQKKEQGIQFAANGIMMWEEQAIEHWMSTAGGGSSRQQSKAKWDDWAAHHKERKVAHDFRSPHEDGGLRLRVPTTDEVNFISASMKGKSVTCSDQAIKKPKLEDLGKLEARAMTGFDAMGNSSNDNNQLDMAQQMVSAGGGQAFADVGVLLPDITALGGATSQEGEAGEPKNLDAAIELPAVDATLSSPLKKDDKKLTKKPWVNFDMEINSAKRNLRNNGLDPILTSLTEVATQLDSGVKQLEALPLQCQKIVLASWLVQGLAGRSWVLS